MKLDNSNVFECSYSNVIWSMLLNIVYVLCDNELIISHSFLYFESHVIKSITFYDKGFTGNSPSEEAT